MNTSMNPWKVTTIGLVLVAATALVTTFVIGQKSETESTTTAPTTQKKKVSMDQPRRATQADIDACNQKADDATTSKTTEILKDAAIGGLGGAGVGAAGGAIADGGKGAGKGAAIGGIVGAAAGALYGINENKKFDEKYSQAYASCMRSRGY